MKKIIMISTLAVVLALTGIWAAQKNTKHVAQSEEVQKELEVNFREGDTKVSVAHAKVESFRSLQELEDHSDLIVRGVKLDGKENVTTSPIGTIMDVETISRFQVSTVYKGVVAQGDVLTVAEPVATHRGVIVSIAGYKAMKQGKEYILFLFKAPDTNNLGIVAVTQGKYSTDRTVELYAKQEEDNHKRIAKYTKEVNDKYSKEQ